MTLPILQFGTGRFLQAHVDFFVSEALTRNEAIGRIAVVQTSDSPQGKARAAAFNRQGGFPVHIRGLQNGQSVDRVVTVDSIGHASIAADDWPKVVDRFVAETKVVVSNTADRGYELTDDDRPENLPNVSFPAKLTALLRARFHAGASPLSLIPCELISGNASILRDLVLGIAARWGEGAGFREFVTDGCVWANSLVDRIVAEPLEPLGAVAEPYAIWAIEDRPGLAVPCRHPDVVVTDDLQRYERLKLHILNLGHTYLADIWLTEHRRDDEIVLEMMNDPAVRPSLDTLYDDEVLPIFDAIGLGNAAPVYRDSVIERFSNPYLKHRVRDIAGNHATKKQRRIGRLLELAVAAGAKGPFPRLTALVQGG